MRSSARLLCALLVPLLLPLLGVPPAGRPAGPRRVARLAASPLDVVVSEVAWMGTVADYNDEWIELFNTTALPIDLSGWTLQALDGTPAITLNGPPIPAYGYYLLERSDDGTISNIAADQIYTGALGNDPGETLELRDAGGVLIDTVNGDGGAWPAGDNAAKRTMERIDPLAPGDDGNWATNDGLIRNGRDADGLAVLGTPKLRNSASAPAADLWVLKDAPATVPAGGTIHYTIALGNWGNLAAAATVLTDTLPEGVSLLDQVSPYPFDEPVPGTLVWQVGSLPYTLTAFSISVTGRVALTASGDLLNQLLGTTAVTEVTDANNQDWASTTVQPRLPDLAADKAGPEWVQAGEPIAYTLTVANDGQLAAPDVRLTDTLPAAVTFLSQSSPYSFTQLAPQTLLWEIGSLPTATVAAITVYGQVFPSASGTLTNTLWATTPYSETSLENNLARWTTGMLLPGRVVINEVVAKGTEWVELYSSFDVELDLSGWRLTSEVGGLSYVFPAGTVLPPGGYHVVSTGGTLDNDGDVVRLLFPTWEEVDSVGYGIRGAAPIPPTGFSVARVADGWDTDDDARDWNLDRSETSGAANDPPGVALGTSLILNEFDAYPTAGNDRLEIYNPLTVEVVLTGWLLSDGDDVAPIETAASVPPGGWVVLEETVDWSGFDLTSDDVASLFMPDGTRVDQIGWYGEVEEDTFQRLCDGEGPHDGYDWPSSGGGVTWRDLPATLGEGNCASLEVDGAVDKAGPAIATIGTPITYTLLYSVTTPRPCAELRLTDTLPAGVTLITFTSLLPLTWNGSTTLPVFEAGPVYQAIPGSIELAAWVSEAVPPGSELVNRVDLFCLGDVDPANDWSTISSTVRSGEEILVHLPLLLQGYREAMRIEAVFYDGYQAGDVDEAVRLINQGSVPVDLAGWELCKDTGGGALGCRALPAVVLAPADGLWVARSAISFTRSFGYAPDAELDSWLPYGLSNSGDEVILRNPYGGVIDVLVYGDSPYTGTGWLGPALDPYGGSMQLLQRILDEATGLPRADTDTAADWMQVPDDPAYGRRTMRPGWDVEVFFQPLAATEEASVTVAIAPDHAAEVFLAAIGRAQASIEAEFYELGHAGVVQALVERASQGVEVTVLLEGGPVGGLTDQERWACQQLEAAGGQCWFMVTDAAAHIYDRYDYLHSKLVLIDRQWVVISSQNPTAGGMPDDDKSDGTWGSRGVLLLTDAPSVVARAVEIWEADWDPGHHVDLLRWDAADPTYGLPLDPTFQPITSSGGISSTVRFPQPLSFRGPVGWELFSAPEAALRQSDALLGLVAQAGVGDRLEVEQMYEYAAWGSMPDGSAAPNLRLEAYLEAARRGAQVRILLNSGAFGQDLPYIEENTATLSYVNSTAICEGLDLQARLGDPTDYGIHNKMVLVSLSGEGYAHVGSINGSEGSSKRNREIAVQLRSTEVYAYLDGMFESDWQQAGHVLISEVMFNPAGDDSGFEWFELYNPMPAPVDLSGWSAGDAVVWGEYGSGVYAFPAGAVLPAHGIWVVAAQAADFAAAYGFAPHFEIRLDAGRDDPAVPNLVPLGAWEGFGFALGNTGDEVALWDAEGIVEDVLVYGTGSYPGVSPYWRDPAAGHSLERRPPDLDTEDCAFDFADCDAPTPAGWPQGYPACGQGP